jgi:hypothetical protein
MTFPNAQNNPAAAIPVRLSNGTDFVGGPASATNITTSTTTTVKASAGVLGSLVINAAGSAGATVVLKNGATVLATVNAETPLGTTFTYGISCATSIVVVTTGAPNITITWQ